MKNYVLIITAFIALINVSCEQENLRPSSNITVQDRTINDYLGIKVSTAFEVELVISDTEERIEIEANENLHAYIDVFKDDTDLVIKLKDNTNIKGNATLKAYIKTGSSLEKITLNDASSLTMTNELVTDEILLSVTDACYLNAKINASNALVRMEDASRLDLSGSCDQMELFIYDACRLNGLESAINDLIVRMEDASDASLTVNKTIDLFAKDASVFRYRGDAVITNIDLRDASQIIKLD